MKCNFVIGLLSVVAISAFCQPVKPSFVASVSEVNRMSLVKTNIPLTEWHEQSFWTQYKTYLDKIQGVSLQTYTALHGLALTDRTIDNLEAFENGRKLIAYRFDELVVLRQYFVDICREHNGVIGLQFLQTETMLDMMESSRIYDESQWRNFRFLPRAFKFEDLKKAKHNTITKALSLSPQEAAIFFPLYSRYEQESEEVLGEGYNLYALFAAEASDFTPGLAKRQGYDLLTVIEREIKLKEKYFTEMNSVVGSSLAARFLAWEDYYSLICKINVWVEAP